MKAVNLIPEEHRRGPGHGPARSGAGVYLFLGALAIMLIGTAAYVLSANAIKERRGEVTQVKLEATAAAAEASALKPYADFAALKQKRVQTVKSLAESRFDWEHVLGDLSRAMPTSAWLTSFTGTVNPDVQLTGPGGSPLRSSLKVPAVVLTGCAKSQSQVAHMMARMRLIKGVTRVSLDSSSKPDAAVPSAGQTGEAGSSGSGGNTGKAAPAGAGSSCTGGDAKVPEFRLVIFFEGATPPAPAAPGAGTTGGTTGTTGTTAGTTGTTAGTTGGTTTTSTPPTTGGTTGAAPAAPAPVANPTSSSP
jgi:Tfp pilus assembly protein PilN